MSRSAELTYFVQHRLREMAAGEFVAAHGVDALLVLRERADRARERGHTAASKTWQDMADAAERILIALSRRAHSLSGPSSAGAVRQDRSPDR
jgi:hypothetical protein